MIYLRNVHPKQTMYLPVRPGWCRVLRPAVTTALPPTALHHPAIRQLVAAQELQVVTEVAGSADPDARQRAALRRDLQVALAAAEAKEFDKLRQGITIPPRRTGAGPGGKGRYSRWTPERKARLERLWRAGASVDVIANEVGLGRANVWAVVQRFGLPPRRVAVRQAPDQPSRLEARQELQDGYRTIGTPAAANAA